MHAPLLDHKVQLIFSWKVGHINISATLFPLELIQEENLANTGKRIEIKNRCMYDNNPNISTDKSGQTVQTKIRLLLMEQSDQGLHCLLFH